MQLISNHGILAGTILLLSFGRQMTLAITFQIKVWNFLNTFISKLKQSSATGVPRGDVKCAAM